MEAEEIDIRNRIQGDVSGVNITYYKEKGTSNIHQMIYFNDVSDMVDCCTRNHHEWNDRGHTVDASDRNWTFGKEFPDLDTTYKALMQGNIPVSLIAQIDKVKVSLYEKHPELFELERSASKLKRRRVFAEAGDELDIDKYMSGEVEMWQKMTRRPTKQCMRIMVNSCLHCGHDSAKFVQGMIMLTAFLDILDKSGIASEVWYAPVSRDTSSGVSLAGVFSRIKGPEEVLDVCKMLSCGAPGLFRYYTFKVWTNMLHGTPHYGLGRMVESKDELTLVKELNKFDVMINANDTPEETFNIISSTLKELFD
jgi:hypothetical protein